MNARETYRTPDRKVWLVRSVVVDANRIVVDVLDYETGRCDQWFSYDSSGWYFRRTIEPFDFEPVRFDAPLASSW